MDRAKQPMEPLDLDEKELTMGIEEIDANEAMLITCLLHYIPPRKSTTNVTKDPNLVKFQVSRPLLSENILFEGNILARILYLKME